MTLLPAVPDEATYLKIYRQDTVWRAAMNTICERHGLDPGRLEPAGSGTNVVYFAGERVIKLYPPLWASDMRPERAALGALTGQPGIPTPQLIAEGGLEDWVYLVLTRLPGVRIGDVWRELPETAQLDLLEQLGELLARVHATPVDAQGREDLRPPGGDWPGFVRRQLSVCVAHHRKHGASEPWLEAIEAFLPTVDFGGERPHVLLSGDVTDDHLLLEERDGRWQITGFFDLGDAMWGDSIYELTTPGVFLTAGRPRLRKALVQAFGYDLTSDLSRRLLGWTLLHRYGHLVQILRFVAGPAPRDLTELQVALWGFE